MRFLFGHCPTQSGSRGHPNCRAGGGGSSCWAGEGVESCGYAISPASLVPHPALGLEGKGEWLQDCWELGWAGSSGPGRLRAGKGPSPECRIHGQISAVSFPTGAPGDQILPTGDMHERRKSKSPGPRPVRSLLGRCGCCARARGSRVSSLHGGSWRSRTKEVCRQGLRVQKYLM